MFRQKTESKQAEQKEQAIEAGARTGTDPAVLVAGASVLFSLHQFFLRGNREIGMFVGLWPPTILAFASYFTQSEMSDKVRQLI